jgi:hypothetical protein
MSSESNAVAARSRTAMWQFRADSYQTGAAVRTWEGRGHVGSDDSSPRMGSPSLVFDQDVPISDRGKPADESAGYEKDSLAVQLALRDVYRTLAAIDQRIRLYLIRG